MIRGNSIHKGAVCKSTKFKLRELHDCSSTSTVPVINPFMNRQNYGVVYFLALMKDVELELCTCIKRPWAIEITALMDYHGFYIQCTCAVTENVIGFCTKQTSHIPRTAGCL